MVKINSEIKIGNKTYVVENIVKDQYLLRNDNNVLNWIDKNQLVSSLQKINFTKPTQLNESVEEQSNDLIFENDYVKVAVNDLTESFGASIFYHGSHTKDITKFNTPNIFWSTDIEFSAMYGQFIYKAQLNLGKCFDLNQKRDFNWLLKECDYNLIGIDDNGEEHQLMSFNEYHKLFKDDNWGIVEHNIDVIKKHFDSCKIYEQGTKNYIVFDNRQVKLIGYPTTRNMLESTEIVIYDNNNKYKKVFNCGKKEAIQEFHKSFNYYNELTENKLVKNGFIKESIYHASQWKDDYGQDVFFTIERNPSKKEFWDAIKKSKSKKLRGILGVDKWSNLYIWDAYYGTHDDIYNHYLRGDDKLRKGFAQLYMDKDGIKTFGFSADSGRIKEKYYGKEIESNKTSDKMKAIFNDDDLGLLSEAIEYKGELYDEWTEETIDITVWRNPSVLWIQNYLNTDYNSLRFIYNSQVNKLWVWDAMLTTHTIVADALDLDGDIYGTLDKKGISIWESISPNDDFDEAIEITKQKMGNILKQIYPNYENISWSPNY